MGIFHCRILTLKRVFATFIQYIRQVAKEDTQSS